MDRNQVAREELKAKVNADNCTYPLCKDKKMMSLALPMIRMKDNKVEQTDMQLTVNTCGYHFPILASGLFAILEHPEDPNKKIMYGPVDLVQGAEAVITGMIMSGKLQKLIKTKADTDSQMEALNENKATTP